MSDRCSSCVERQSSLRSLTTDEEVLVFSAQIQRSLRIGSRLCSVCARPRKCAYCKKRPHRGRAKKIETEDDVARFSARLRIPLIVGCYLCDACRRLEIPVAEDEELGAVGGAAANVDQAAPEHEAMSVEEDSDPSFDANLAPEGRPVIYPVPRIAATNRWCIFCKSVDNRHRVALSIRRDVFNRAKLYIPDGCRTCETWAVAPMLQQ